MRIVLTDEEDIVDAVGKLRSVYKRLMTIDYDNERTRSNSHIDSAPALEKKSPLELFSELFELQNNRAMTQRETEIVSSMLSDIGEVCE